MQWDLNGETTHACGVTDRLMLVVDADMMIRYRESSRDGMLGAEVLVLLASQ